MSVFVSLYYRFFKLIVIKLVPTASCYVRNVSVRFEKVLYCHITVLLLQLSLRVAYCYQFSENSYVVYDKRCSIMEKKSLL